MLLIDLELSSLSDESFGRISWLSTSGRGFSFSFSLSVVVSDWMR